MTKTFRVNNYKGVRTITLEPNGALVVIAGANGAGKSSFIDAFVELFDPRGTRLTPKPIRDGEHQAVAEYTDTDLGLRITRTWRKDDAGQLTVHALDGAKYAKPSDVVASLTGGLIFDPVAFLNLDDRRQRAALLEKVDLPFDLDALDREKAAAHTARLEAGREVKRLQGALASMPTHDPGNPVAEVSAASILDELTEAADHNGRIDAATAQVDRLRATIDRLQRELGMAQLDLAEAQGILDEAGERVDTDVLRDRLATVEVTNEQVRAAREYNRVAADLAAAEDAQAGAQDTLTGIERRKAEGLAAAEFPVPGLSVDEQGISVDGIPFTQVNSAARRRVAFAIATAGEPRLRLVIVKDGDLLDADSLDAIRGLAEERGYTVLMERDRDESRRIGFTITDGELAG